MIASSVGAKVSKSKVLPHSLNFISVVIGIVATSPNSARADALTLTPAGLAAGFSLSTFATMDPGNTGCCAGPFGVAVAVNGNILVYNAGNRVRYAFNDVDGQTIASAVTSTMANPTGAIAYASAGGQAYGGIGEFTQFAQYNSNGTVSKVLTGVPQTTFRGMWGNAVNGHILATTSQGQIIDIDPNGNNGTGSSRVVASPGAVYDGLSVSPDGTVVYVDMYNASRIFGYDVATGAQVFDSGPLANGPDGIGIISSHNSLNGKMIINFNGNGVNTGQVGLLDPATNGLTIIATGGTRGDYVSPDVTNGTLFMDYSDVVYRLSCGSDCSIGAPPTIPEPSTLALVGAALTGLWLARARRAK